MTVTHGGGEASSQHIQNDIDTESQYQYTHRKSSFEDVNSPFQVFAMIAEHQNPTARQKEAPEDSTVIEAQKLFQGRKEILIQHDGEQYRLRITRRNKLILQK